MEWKEKEKTNVKTSGKLKTKDNEGSIPISKSSYLLLPTGAIGTTSVGKDCVMENEKTMETKELSKGNYMKKRKRPKGMEALKCNQDRTEMRKKAKEQNESG